MASVHIFVLSVLSFLVLSRCMGEMRNFKCPPPFNCGKLGQISPPFSNRSNSRCGLVLVGDCDQPVQKIQFQRGSSGKWYEVRNISQANTMNILDKELNRQLQIRDCRVFNNLSLPSHSFYAFKIETNITLFRCNRCSNCSPPLTDFNYTKCNHDVHYNRPNKSMPSCPPHCSTIQLPLNKTVVVNDDPFKFIDSQFLLGLHVWPPCLECIFEGGYCQDDKEGRFQCAGKSPKGNGKRRSVKVGIAVGVSVIGLLIICSIFVGFWYCNRRKFGPTNFLSVRTSSNPSSKSSLERDNAFFGVPVFKYDDLQKATNYFDEANELGDGGYGTVYHGQLQDGREVAVKRLYDNNYKRVEQFVNEIKILTLLRHKNLVTLYGCTSRRSRELLLVYEFISNGTVADHLHCERPSSLTWPVRLRIAIETASALAYLHASDIIHRDVKTSNILLDNNFSVKVADFGLSRLFPNDVTHISTAPQGTPGYVDPEYHQCYQLTEKSDVYSFGVVLIELISSLPAVDISRDRDEINLSNLAVNRIQNKAFHHLVDPCLGFESDCGVRRMTILVAELACQCLQLDREERPSMDDVLGALRRIYDEGYGREKTEQADNIGAMTSCVARPPASPESEDGVLLKRLHLLTSPTSVTDKWVSQSTTPNISV